MNKSLLVIASAVIALAACSTDDATGPTDPGPEAPLRIRRDASWNVPEPELALVLIILALLAMIWLWRDSADSERVAALAGSTFWFIIPSLPLFFVLPVLLRSGLGFWLSMGIVVVGTLALYALTFWAAPKLGLKL